MTTFDDKLHASAQRIRAKEDRKMHVPQNPLKQHRTYWGWVATPAAAVAGLVFGLSVPMFLDKEPDIKYVHDTDTVQIVHPVHDTLYLTQIVEREKYIVRQTPETVPAESAPVQETAEPACTSVDCDGINYSILALN